MMTNDPPKGPPGDPSPDAEPELLNVERLQATRVIAGTWIAAADLKATALLALAGAMVAVVVPMFTAMPALRNATWAGVLLGLFAFSQVVAIVCALMVLLPRTNRTRMLGPSWPDGVLTNSFTFFGDLGVMRGAALKAHLLSAQRDQKLYARDAFEQTKVVCRIAHIKMCWMRGAVLAILAGLLITVVPITVLSWSWMPKAQGGSEGAPSIPKPSMHVIPAADPYGVVDAGGHGHDVIANPVTAGRPTPSGGPSTPDR